MIPARIESQIQRQMEETRTQALLSSMFDRINQSAENKSKQKEDSRLAKKSYWWQDKEFD